MFTWGNNGKNCQLCNIFAGTESESSRSYQTYAGDAGVVGDVGDVEDFSFVLTAGLGTWEGQQEGGKGEMEAESEKRVWTFVSDQPS